MAINNNGTWPYRVLVGDILRDCNGTERIVRKCSEGESGLTTYVYFSILRCSWTHRCYTCMSYTDLKMRGFRPVGKKKLKSKLDKQIAHDLRYETRFNQKLDCCAVSGVR